MIMGGLKDIHTLPSNLKYFCTILVSVLVLFKTFSYNSSLKAFALNTLNLSTFLQHFKKKKTISMTLVNVFLEGRGRVGGQGQALIQPFSYIFVIIFTAMDLLFMLNLMPTTWLTLHTISRSILTCLHMIILLG